MASVAVLDLTTNSVVTTIPVGSAPVDLGMRPDGSRVYVTNSGSNTVSVINTATNLVVATVSGNQVTLAWDAVAGTTSCVLEAGYAPGLADAATVSLIAAGLNVDGVPSGTYYVRAVAGGARSAPSAEIVVVVD